jgi:hypothetical protein
LTPPSIVDGRNVPTALELVWPESSSPPGWTSTPPRIVDRSSSRRPVDVTVAPPFTVTSTSVHWAVTSRPPFTVDPGGGGGGHVFLFAAPAGEPPRANAAPAITAAAVKMRNLRMGRSPFRRPAYGPASLRGGET